MIKKSLLQKCFFLFLANATHLLLSLDAQEPVIEIKASGTSAQAHTKKVKLLLAYKPDEHAGYKALIKELENALGWSGHLAISSKKMEAPQSKQEILQLVQDGYPLVLFMEYDATDNTIVWRLYDAIHADMVKGKKYGKKSVVSSDWAAGIAQELWPELLQEPGIFTTKLAYVRRLSKGRDYHSQICVTNYDGTDEKVILDMPTLYVELSFHPDAKAPRLLTSEFTFDGIRLIMLDLQGKRRTVLGGDKSIIGASLSDSADTVVYTESGNIWRYTHGKQKGSSQHTLLVRTLEKCSSARLCNDSKDIIYCSDNRIYRYKNSDKKSVLVTDNGIAPDYCATKKTILFSRRIKDAIQLFLLDEVTGKQQQLTFDSGNKTDARFSPCGNYLVFCHEKKNKKAITTLCIATGKRHTISKGTVSYGYPTWSPSYNQ